MRSGGRTLRWPSQQTQGAKLGGLPCIKVKSLNLRPSSEPKSAGLCLYHIGLGNYYFLKYKLIYFNWRLITLQYCIGFAIH